MVIWTASHRALVVDAFFKSGDSVVTTQRLFRRKFNIPHHGAVPSPNTIKLILIPYGSIGWGQTSYSKSNNEYAGYSFSEQVVSQNGNVQWPARSPDLTACDYFLWGFLRVYVYVTMPSNVNKLKHRISEEIRAIQPDLIQKVIGNLIVRLNECVRTRGRHLSDVIFKK